MNFDENGRRISPHEILKNKQIYLRSPMRSDLCHGTCVHFQVSKFNFREAKVRCHICDIFIRIQGTKDSVGRICSCCGVQLGRTISQVEKYGKNGVVNDKMGDDFWTEKNKKKNQFNNSESEKRDISVGVEEFDESKKTYSELKEFIEEGMKLQANYQLVMLDELVSNDTRHKGQIAEAIAFWNNKDPSDLEVLKYYMDMIPVYDVLIKGGFVRYASDYNSPISPVFTLNVDLEEFQQARIQELITEKLEQWNKEHGIPDNEFPNADTKNNVIWTAKWRKVPEVTQPSTLERPEGVSVGSKYWIWSVTEENWDKVVQKKVWGSKADVENIEKYVQKGDKIIFYVKGTNQFKGIMKLSSDWQDDSRNLRWTDEIQEQEVIYNSFVELKQVVLGVADIDLLENLEIFKEKPREQRGFVLKGTGGGYPANNCRPIPDSDYEKIKQLLDRDPSDYKRQKLESVKRIGEKWEAEKIEDESEEELKIDSRGMATKICPCCKFKFFGYPDSQNFENKMEMFFGYRPKRNLSDEGEEVRIPQSWCRKCRKHKYRSKESLLENQLEFQKLKRRNREGWSEENYKIESDLNKKSILKLFMPGNENDVKILNCNVMYTEIIKKGQILSNDELIEKFGVGNMGGIRYSSKNNIIVLCDTKSGHYDDKIDKDFEIIYYTGEGKEDQSLTGGNQRILDANTQHTPMFYFIEVPQEPGQRKRGALDNIYEFVGRVRYTKHVFKNEENVDGVSRKVIKFLLEVEK